MNGDTIRKIAEIKECKWYPQSTVLGEGGWDELRPVIRDWKRYELFIGDEPESVFSITAMNDEVAEFACNSQFRLDNTSYAIMEKIVTWRTVKEA